MMSKEEEERRNERKNSRRKEILILPFAALSLKNIVTDIMDDTDAERKREKKENKCNYFIRHVVSFIFVSEEREELILFNAINRHTRVR